MTTDAPPQTIYWWKASAFALLSPILAAPLLFGVLFFVTHVTDVTLFPSSPKVPDSLLLQTLEQTYVALYLSLMIGLTHPFVFAAIVAALSLTFVALTSRWVRRFWQQMLLAGLLSNVMFASVWVLSEVFQWKNSLFN